MWNDVAVVLDLLNGNGRDTADGISEDESDFDEKGKRRKRVVRILKRDWINKDIPKLLQAVDTYAQDSLDDFGRLPQGNTSYTRELISKNTDKRQFMTGLPRNFYDDDWYKNLDETEKSLVLAEDRVVVIPSLVRAMRSLSLLTNKTDLCSLLGLDSVRAKLAGVVVSTATVSKFGFFIFDAEDRT